MEKSLEIPSSEQEVLDNIKIDLQRVNIELDESILKKKLEIRRKEYPGISEDDLDEYKFHIIFQKVGLGMNRFVVYNGHIILLNISRPKKILASICPSSTKPDIRV